MLLSDFLVCKYPFTCKFHGWMISALRHFLEHMPSGHQNSEKSSLYPSELHTPENKQKTVLTPSSGLGDLTWFCPGSERFPELAPIAGARGKFGDFVFYLPCFCLSMQKLHLIDGKGFISFLWAVTSSI